ncbi:MAG: hypothetical protein K2J00_06880 [Bacteroidaceae bacterium]|nr:hypothetical protein [Bacteroidaceae bacterium]
MKYLVYIFPVLLLWAVLLAGCCPDLPEQAAGNRWELYRTLAYYRYVERDTAKYAAARFLIENMPCALA